MGRQEEHNDHMCCQIDTKCRFAMGIKLHFDDWGSGWVHGGGVQQHDRYVVLNGVNTVTDGAFQALPIRV